MGYELLANAIIERALLDYKKAAEKPHLPESKEIMAEIEDFLLSEWFELLSDGMDGQVIVKKLRGYLN